MTDPVARDRLAALLREDVTYWEDRLAQHPEDATVWADALLVAGVLPPDTVYEDPARWGERFEPDTLAKVRAEIEALPVLRVGGDTLLGDPPLLNREAVLAALEAASGTPEPPAPHAGEDAWRDSLVSDEQDAANRAYLAKVGWTVPPPAAPGLPAELDVERLAWAEHRVTAHGTDRPCYDDRAKAVDVERMRLILAEYAALAKTPGEPE